MGGVTRQRSNKRRESLTPDESSSDKSSHKPDTSNKVVHKKTKHISRQVEVSS